MVVFVCGAQLLFEQCDCAVPVRARYREGVRILLSCTSRDSWWSSPVCGQCLVEGSVPSTARGMCPDALIDVSRSKPALLSPCGLPGLGTWDKCAKADRFLLPPLLACPAEENNQKWPPQRSDFGRISVVSCCWQHLLEKGSQTGYLGTLLLKTFQFHFLLHVSQLSKVESTALEVADYLVLGANKRSDFASPLWGDCKQLWS